MDTEKKPFSAGAAADFLKNLPSYKKENFSRFVADSSSRNTNQPSKTDTRVVCGDDSTSQGKVIVTEKTSILLRYLHEQWDRKHNTRKRALRRESDDCEYSTSNHDDGCGASGSTQNGQPARKMPRAL